jgi:anaerobic ribonucleoside-triphosphate reductase activating protein
MTSIGISRLHFPVTTLGPGRRIGIWFQGCSIRCKGCISLDTWASGRKMTTLRAVTGLLERWLPETDGFTISGGEPFDQPLALAALLREIRSKSDADILVYSGYPVEFLTSQLAEMDGLIDALITDPFEIDDDRHLALRGSGNQRLHCLTPVGIERFAEYERTAASDDKAFDVMMDDSGTIWLAGIPGRNDFKRLREILESQHHTIVTTEDRLSETR